MRPCSLGRGLGAVKQAEIFVLEGFQNDGRWEGPEGLFLLSISVYIGHISRIYAAFRELFNLRVLAPLIRASGPPVVRPRPGPFVRMGKFHKKVFVGGNGIEDNPFLEPGPNCVGISHFLAQIDKVFSGGNMG